MSKQIKLRFRLFFYGFEPLNCGGGVFPLIELGCSHDFAVDSVEDYFADLSYLRFGGVHQSVGWCVGEVRFVVFEKLEKNCALATTNENKKTNENHLEKISSHFISSHNKVLLISSLVLRSKFFFLFFFLFIYI